MTRRAALTAAFAAALTLAGCTAAPTPTPTPTIPDYSDQITPATYLQLMHTIPDFAHSDDAALLRVAGDTCKVMEKPNGWQTAVATFAKAGHGQDQASAAIQYAVTAYCPDLESKIPTQ